jgi:hypothetical protein
MLSESSLYLDPALWPWTPPLLADRSAGILLTPPPAHKVCLKNRLRRRPLSAVPPANSGASVAVFCNRPYVQHYMADFLGDDYQVAR